MDIKQHKTAIVGLTFLALAVALSAWPNRGKERQRTRGPVPVRTARVEARAAKREVRFSGVTRAARRALLAFPQAARLVSRPVEVGDHVARGAALATLDQRGFENAADGAAAALAQAAARLAQAERDLARVERLASLKAATAEELEHVQAASEAARAAHAAAEAQMAEANRAKGEATLHAPFAGTVTAVFLQPGEMAGAGAPVVELSGDGAVELRVEVPESVVGRLAERQPVEAELPFAEHVRVSGRIRSIARAAIGPGRLFPLVVTLEKAPQLRAGMTAELALEVATDSGLTVPLGAVLNPGSSRPAVFIVREGRARRVPVRVGDLSGERIVVSGKLAEGDVVIVAGHTRLADGDPVEVRP